MIAVAVGLVATSLTVHAAESAPSMVRIEAISNRADVVSGGDLLLRIRSSAGTDHHRVALLGNGKRIQSALHRDPSGKGVLAYVTGLREGKPGGSRHQVQVPLRRSDRPVGCGRRSTSSDGGSRR